MSAMASQITGVSVIYSTFCSGLDKSSASLAFVTGEFPAQKGSNAENVSIWWRQHGTAQSIVPADGQVLLTFKSDTITVITHICLYWNLVTP